MSVLQAAIAPVQYRAAQLVPQPVPLLKPHELDERVEKGTAAATLAQLGSMINDSSVRR